MVGIVNIVTGATQGIGLAIAESIACHTLWSSSNNQHHLFIVGRNKERGQQAVEKIRKACSTQNVYFEPCDLSDYNDVLNLQERISKQVNDDSFRVNCLVNNAAECPKRQIIIERPKRDGTTQQVDKQFATNVLGYHFMMKVFHDHFFHVSDDTCQNDISSTTTSDTTYVLNVASNWAGDLDLKDVSFLRRGYDNDSAYRQSKQCDRMLTKIWSDKLQEEGKYNVKVNSCHPGEPKTKLSVDLGYNMYSPTATRQMIESQTPIPYLCGLKGNLQVTGGWFGGHSDKPSSCRFMKMTTESQQLYDMCEEFCYSS